MPLTAKGKEILAKFKQEYGEKGESYFYAAKNKGTITGVDSAATLDDIMAHCDAFDRRYLAVT